MNVLRADLLSVIGLGIGLYRDRLGLGLAEPRIGLLRMLGLGRKAARARHGNSRGHASLLRVMCKK